MPETDEMDRFDALLEAMATKPPLTDPVPNDEPRQDSENDG